MRFIGCKTQLLGNIKEILDKHVPEAGSFCDLFSGTAVVARYFKQWYAVTSNDLLYFSYCLQKGTIENDSVPAFRGLAPILKGQSPLDYFNSMPTAAMESLPAHRQFFRNNYGPAGGRMYLTDANALRIDFARNTVEDWRADGLLGELEYYYLVACIVEGIPFVSNIAGTYGAFHKFWDARAEKPFMLFDLPVPTNGRENRSFNEDGSRLLERLSGDILYIDPPYNERQYPPNYHVLETAARYDSPVLHGVTGQRSWEGQRSAFCSKRTAAAAFEEIVAKANFRHILLSYNTEGIMTLPEIEAIMKAHGKPETFEAALIPYRRYKSRDSARGEGLREMLVYIEKAVGE